MKKLLGVILSVVMLISVVSLAGCGKAETLKFGLGVTSYIENVKNADGDTNGATEATSTFAAVLLDGEGKIVKCAIDTAAHTLSFTSKGEYVEASEFKTKYEAGKNYGMVAYGGAKKEWFEQVDAFTALVAGKTLQDVKALVSTNGKGNDEVVTAGCTIIITDFITALEKAVNNAADSSATADSTLKIGVISTQTGSKNATAEADGVNEVDVTVTATALDKDGKIAAAKTDAIQVIANFNNKGVASTTANTAFTTKVEAGDNYGMKAYGQDLNGDGAVKEWYAQAAAFDNACIGKTANDISALATEKGYGVDTLQSAGCTINISDMVKAAVKAAK
ncbi:MAG: hypothetical protein IKK65_02525 [Clostridia bacterium]|nr:hypothetical protein [Clostridia bacterium]